MTERIADDAAEAAGDGAHRDRHQRRRANVRGLDRAGNGDQRQAEGVEPQQRAVA